MDEDGATAVAFDLSTVAVDEWALISNPMTDAIAVTIAQERGGD